MKRLAPLLSLALLVNCAAKSESTSETLGSESSGGGQRTERRIPLTQSLLVFRKDQRPVDGRLVEIQLKRSNGERYAISVRMASRNFETGLEGDDTEFLGSGFECADVKSVNPRIECRMDQRPADGKLTVVEFRKNAAGKFDSRLDQLSSRGNTNYRILGTDLELQKN